MSSLFAKKALMGFGGLTLLQGLGGIQGVGNISSGVVSTASSGVSITKIINDSKVIILGIVALFLLKLSVDVMKK